MMVASFAAQKEVLSLAATFEADENEIPAKKKSSLSRIKPGGEVPTKTIGLKTDDPTKMAIIGTNLSSK